MEFSNLTRCTDLKGEHIAAAVQSSDAMGALVRRFGELAKPDKGGPLILAALARLGTTACDWIDGELRIELVAEGAKTRIVVSTSIGAGFREAPFPSVLFDAPLAEFARTIAKSPKVIEPLVSAETASRIVLTATEELRRTSLPPTAITIDSRSIVEVPKLEALSPPFELDEPSAGPSPPKEPKQPKPSVAAKKPPSIRRTSARPPASPGSPPKVPRPTPKKS